MEGQGNAVKGHGNAANLVLKIGLGGAVVLVERGGHLHCLHAKSEPR